MSTHKDNVDKPTATFKRTAVAPATSLTKRAIRLRVVIGIAIVVALVATYVVLLKTGALDMLLNGPALRQRVVQLGPMGPLLVIGLMAGAIVINPIPSAPIALAAGAAYGHTWGTIYILTGAEIGALIAFAIARLLGCRFVEKLCRQHESLQLLGSQNALTAIVFVSRLIPFISFDLVSYAAGLTAISTWRFAAATLAGIMPASFLLAHFGAEMVSSDPVRIAISGLALGILTLTPIVIKLTLDKRRKRVVNQS